MLQLTAALDKKEALLQQLRAMNDEASAGAQVDPVTKRHSEAFQQAYAAVVQQLKQVCLPFHPSQTPPQMQHWRAESQRGMISLSGSSL